MKLAVEFPSVAYREGPDGVAKLARAIEEIGYDQLDMFDHVVMGYPMEGRSTGPYPANMPILEALVTLAFIAAATERIGLGTEVLVLPQRQPTLVAKQVGSIDTLSGGRVRLGIGVGWQESEFEALGVDIHQRGSMMDEAIRLMRAYWSDATIDFEGKHYRAQAVAMEPKPPQGGALPIWVGGISEAALKRTGELADGWLGSVQYRGEPGEAITKVKRYAEAAGRDPEALGFQGQLSSPPRNDSADARSFYADHALVAATAASLKEEGYGWATVNVTGVFLAGARSVDEMCEALKELHDRIRAEVGYD